MMAGGGGAGGAGVGVVAGRVSTGVTARRCASSGPAGSALAEGSGAGVAADAGSASEAAGAAGSGSPRVGAGAGNPAVSVDTVMDSADARGDSDGAGTDVAPAAAAGAASFEGVAWRLGPTPMPRKARGATVASRLFTSLPRPSGVLCWTLPSNFSPGVGAPPAPHDP